MDGTTLTADAATVNNRRILLGQLATIRSLMHQKNDDDSHDFDVDEDVAKEGMPLKNDKQLLAAISTQLLLTTVLLDVVLLRLFDEGEMPSSVYSDETASVSDQQQLMLTRSDAIATRMIINKTAAAAAKREETESDAAATKKKKKRTAASKNRKRRNKRKNRNKEEAENEKTKLTWSWLGGIISLIMMVTFGSSVTKLTFPLSLIHQSDGSDGGEVSPALPPSASRSLRQKHHHHRSISPDISSPSPAAVPSPIFSPTVTAAGNLRMKSEELRASTCYDTPNWKDVDGTECYIYEIYFDPGCPDTDSWAGSMGPATGNCCYCGGGSTTLPLPPPFPVDTSIPTMLNTAHPYTYFPTESSGGGGGGLFDYFDDDFPPTLGRPGLTRSPSPTYSPQPSSSPTTSTSPTSFPSISSNPTQFCLNTPKWRDNFENGCAFYEKKTMLCPKSKDWAGSMGPATDNCCECSDSGGTRTVSRIHSFT